MRPKRSHEDKDQPWRVCLCVCVWGGGVSLSASSFQKPTAPQPEVVAKWQPEGHLSPTHFWIKEKR